MSFSTIRNMTNFRFQIRLARRTPNKKPNFKKLHSNTSDFGLGQEFGDFFRKFIWWTQKILGWLRKFWCQKFQARNFWLAESHAFNIEFIKFFQSQKFFLTWHQKILAVPFFGEKFLPQWNFGHAAGTATTESSLWLQTLPINGDTTKHFLTLLWFALLTTPTWMIVNQLSPLTHNCNCIGLLRFVSHLCSQSIVMPQSPMCFLLSCLFLASDEPAMCIACSGTVLGTWKISCKATC